MVPSPGACPLLGEIHPRRIGDVTEYIASGRAIEFNILAAGSKCGVELIHNHAGARGIESQRGAAALRRVPVQRRHTERVAVATGDVDLLLDGR